VSKLYQNYPNPFNPSTTIRFDLAKGGPVKLSIYNIKGQLVNCLVDDYLREGTHTIVWNGKDKQNRSVSSGIYFIRIESKEFNSVRRAILMK
ncbi:MAG TPA: T9SS type A sorting domain-containing protein, partial [Candidatus Syntrophosphaera thermopropionivorans]|nr:T9SS type A sorting domain-containing protein [Candidatus Syntrophosphaera thermopropionivorans]